jgi:glycosyltransferase involved in cell wall biosynthesis
MMAKDSVVSVVMTVLDGEQFIDEAIQSVFDQTYPNWELLIVDDGSTDRSTAIVRDLASRQRERVRYLEHPGHANRGTSASRNLGMAQARGDYIAFLDADDVYLPDRLARHVALLDADPAVDMVQSDTLRWYSWSDAASNDIRVPWPFEADMLVRAPGMLRRSLDRLPRDGYFPSVCSVTFRRAAVGDVGGFEHEFAVCEDWVFFSKLYLHKSVRVGADVVAKYRKRPNSTLHRAQSEDATLLGRYFHIHVAYLRWLKTYLEEQGADPMLIKRVRRQLWPDGSQILCGVLGFPPAIALAWRMRGVKRVIRFLLPEPAYERLKSWWRAGWTTSAAKIRAADNKRRIGSPW